MNTDDLIKLAQKADLEGDMELADYLDNQLIRVSQSLKQRLTNFFAPVTNFVKRQSLPKYDVDFKNLKSDASNLNMIAGHPAPFGNKAQKFFQYGVKNIERSPERLVQIGDMIKGRIKGVVTNDPTIQSAITKFNNNQKLNVKERNALLNHLVNNEQIAKRNNDVSPDDIIKVLDGKVPDVTTKQVTTLSNAAKSAAGLGVVGSGALGIGAYNASQQNAGYQPGGVYQDPNAAGSPFQEMPEMGGGMPSMGEMPQMGGGGGYQGPNYSMPSANQSFQSMEGYRPANQVDQLPRYNDQAEPLYPRISPQQAMQNAMYVDKARRFDELNANANRPADAPIVGPGVPVPATESPLTAQDFVGRPGFGGATDAAGIAAELRADEQAQRRTLPGGVLYSQQPTQTDYLPAPPVTEGTNDPNANVIYNPETSPRTENY